MSDCHVRTCTWYIFGRHVGFTLGSGKARVVLTSRFPVGPLERMRAEYDLDDNRGPAPMPRADLKERLASAEGLVCFPYDSIDSDLMDAAPNLRAISTFSVGLDHIDLEHARRRGIRVGYTPDVLTDTTADLAVGLMLDVMRRISEGDRRVRAGRWKSVDGATDYVGSDLRGKTLGIVGMGRIGSAVARRATVFGMNVIYCGGGPGPAGSERVNMSDLCVRSDVISLHAPYTPQTDRMVNAEFLQSMKDTAFLVNTARGRLVDEKALADALEQKALAGAALDVFESEPAPASHRLAGMDNTVLCPHMGSSTSETREAMGWAALENLRCALDGRDPPDSAYRD